MKAPIDYYITLLASYIADESRDYRYNMLVHLFERVYKEEPTDAEMSNILHDWSQVIEAIQEEEEK
tara:strand:+ start:284 stop:481 length:198 start_codon:yes stop_codon:yes gene_type:complete